MSVSNQYAEILQFIKAHRNGEAAQSMAARGLIYNINYGVSIVHIREEAKRIGKNHVLSEHLWNEQIRETKLFALYLFDASKCNFKKINDIVKSINTIELAEQAAITIVSDYTVTLDMINTWCSHESFFVKLTGYNTLIHKIKTHKLPIEDFGTFFDMLKNEIAIAEVLPQKCITFALLEIAKLSKELKVAVEQFVEKIKTVNTKNTAIIVNTVLEELKFIN